MSLNQELEQTLGDLRAAMDDVECEITSLADGYEIDAGMIDGALFHAETAVGRLQRLRETLSNA